MDLVATGLFQRPLVNPIHVSQVYSPDDRDRGSAHEHDTGVVHGLGGDGVEEGEAEKWGDEQGPGWNLLLA